MTKREERDVLGANSLKRCSNCKVIKKHPEFHRSKCKWDGLSNECKYCAKERQKAHQQANKDKLKDYNKAYYESNRDKLKAQQKAYYKANKDRVLAHNKAYNEANRDKRNTYLKSYYEANKDKLKDYNKAYQEANRDERAKYYAERLKSDSLFRLSHNTRGLIQGAIKRGGYSKDTKTAKILGCSFQELSNWLDFEKWINEDCHIDHVVPVSFAETEEEILVLNHYSNLQVLSAEENIKKGNRFILKSNLQRVLENHPKSEVVINIINRNNIFNKVMDKPKRPCNCWLEVGSCYCEVDKNNSNLCGQCQDNDDCLCK